MRPLTVLSVAFPFAPVGPDAVGGAEQVLSEIDRALAADGHRSLVVARAGSRVAGELLAVPGVIGDEATYPAVRSRIAECLDRADIVHLHGLDFANYLPREGPPTLVTLHLPLDWHDDLAVKRPRTFLHGVSASQCAGHAGLLPPIPNGVDVAALQARHARRGFALMVGRVCPEKGQHLALAAARMAGVSLLLAGEVFDYPTHRDYFEHAVLPLLDARRRWIGPVGFSRKRRLMSAARCVLIPSLAAETSSLVAMEAAACGTPVIAFRSGALSDTIEHERTGLLVADETEMAEAIARIGQIHAETCRSVARARFSSAAMTGAYIARYQTLLC